MEAQIEKTVEVNRLDFAMNLFGNCDENIKIIEEAFGVRILSGDTGIRIVGPSDKVEKADKVVKQLINIAERGRLLHDKMLIILCN